MRTSVRAIRSGGASAAAVVFSGSATTTKSVPSIARTRSRPGGCRAPLPHDRANLDRGRESPYVLRQVTLEDQAPVEAPLHLRHFAGQLLAQSLILDLSDQRLDARHGYLSAGCRHPIAENGRA